MKDYKNIIIYYHTGTGNALKVARWLSDEASKKSIPAKIYSIDKDYTPDYSEITKDTLIGFIYPTHGFNASPAMLKFMFNFKKFKSDYFLCNTRAGGKFFSLFTPGASGIALWLPILMLFLKGLNLVGAKSIDMPSNWISIHPGFPDSWILPITQKCESETKQFILNIFNGKFIILRPILELPIDVILAPISVLYYFIGRYFLAKTFVYSSKCSGCGLCSELCPVNAIKISDNRPFWKYNCESCMRCENICPTKSVQSSHLIFFLAVLMLVFPISDLLNNWFNVSINFGNELFKFLFDNVAGLVLILIIYRILFKLIKYKFVNYIFQYTSLTYYWRRYLALGIKSKDFKK
jgi:Pyruvate/2-oxoacid:ferredoxin oxidoreductase delta subunit